MIYHWKFLTQKREFVLFPGLKLYFDYLSTWEENDFENDSKDVSPIRIWLNRDIFSWKPRKWQKSCPIWSQFQSVYLQNWLFQRNISRFAKSYTISMQFVNGERSVYDFSFAIFTVLKIEKAKFTNFYGILVKMQKKIVFWLAKSIKKITRTYRHILLWINES